MKHMQGAERVGEMMENRNREIENQAGGSSEEETDNSARLPAKRNQPSD